MEIYLSPMERSIQGSLPDHSGIPKVKRSLIIENTSGECMPKISSLIKKHSSIESLDQIREVHTIMTESYEGMS